MAWILSIMTYSEFFKLVICIFFDVLEYMLPFLLQPIIGDVIDVIAILTCIYFYRWIGLFSLLELVPSLDFLPINVVNWIIWFGLQHRENKFG